MSLTIKKFRSQVLDLLFKRIGSVDGRSMPKLTKMIANAKSDKGTEWYLTVNEMKKQETELLPNEQSNLRLRMLKVKPLSTRIE